MRKGQSKPNPKPDTERRTIRKKVNLTAAEDEAIAHMMRKAGYKNFSKFMIDTAMGVEMSEAPATLNKALVDFARLHGLFNQYMHSVNSDRIVRSELFDEVFAGYQRAFEILATMRPHRKARKSKAD